MGLTPKGPGPTGAISHFAAMTEAGHRIIDVWETKEQFEKFAQGTVDGQYRRTLVSHLNLRATRSQGVHNSRSFSGWTEPRSWDR